MYNVSGYQLFQQKGSRKEDRFTLHVPLKQVVPTVLQFVTMAPHELEGHELCLDHISWAMDLAPVQT